MQFFAIQSMFDMCFKFATSYFDGLDGRTAENSLVNNDFEQRYWGLFYQRQTHHPHHAPFVAYRS